MNDLFNRFARWTAALVGSARSFLLAAVGVGIWLVSGPVFGFSDTWQLVINTTTTIITFLIVFLIQNSQNRDTLEIKTDLREMRDEIRELIRAIPEANNQVIERARRAAEDQAK